MAYYWSTVYYHPPFHLHARTRTTTLTKTLVEGATLDPKTDEPGMEEGKEGKEEKQGRGRKGRRDEYGHAGT